MTHDVTHSGAAREDEIERVGMTISQYLAKRGLQGGVHLGTGSSTAAGTADILEADQGRKYAIGDRIATGGMGAILKVKDLNCRRAVAMKVILAKHSQDQETLLRFIEEAQVTAQLEHPSIVPVHELGVDAGGNVFYTMKLVHGVTLRRILDDLAARRPEAIARYPLSQLLNIFQRVCDALAFAHAKGVLHRDLKPENIMVGEFGEVQVMDWGLAKLMGQAAKGADNERTAVKAAPGVVIAGSSPRRAPAVSEHIESSRLGSADSASMTIVGQVAGTPAYMPPEQARGRLHELDTRADIYSLGAVLYHLLALRPPVEGRNVEQVLLRVARGQIQAPAKLNPALRKLRQGQARGLAHLPGGLIPEALSDVVMKAMALKPEDRYASVTELCQELDAWRQGFATRAQDASALTQFLLLLKRQARLAALMGVLLPILAVVGCAAYIRVRNERDTARQAAKVALEKRTRAEVARRELLDLGSTAAGQFMVQARRAMAINDWTGAGNLLAAGLKLTAADPKLWHDQGRLLYSAADFAGAATAFTQEEKLATSSADRFAATQYRKLAESAVAFMKTKDRNKVLAAAASAASKIPDPPVAARLYAAVKVGEGKTDLQQRAADSKLQAILDGLITANPKLNYGGIEVRQGAENTLEIISHSPHLVNLEPLRGCPVRVMNLAGSGVLEKSLEVLSGIPLQELDLSGVPVRSLAVLKGLPLRTLALYTVSDLTPLTGMSLEQLYITSMTGSDLNPLRGMPLTKLRFESCTVQDFSVLAGMPLTHVWLYNCTNIRTIAFLRGAPVQVLSLANNRQITDYSPVAGLPLTELSLDSTNFDDLTLLRGKKLTGLYLAYTKVRELKPLIGMPLRVLSLIGCANITDLTPVAELRELEYVYLPVKFKKQLDGLRELPKLRSIMVESSRELPVAEFWKEYDAARNGEKPESKKP